MNQERQRLYENYANKNIGCQCVAVHDPWTGSGTVFKVTTNGVLTTLALFNGPNGGWPTAALVLGEGGNLYGTTSVSGSREGPPWTGSGTLFKVTTDGVVTTLASFDGTNGAEPQAGLVLGRDGNLYGTTAAGGSSNSGTVYRTTPNGALTNLASFILDSAIRKPLISANAR